MKISLSIELSTTLLAILAVLEVIWIITLIRHLRAYKHSSENKIIWTIVLCTLNLLGLLLYIVMHPGQTPSEQEIKDRFNHGQ